MVINIIWAWCFIYPRALVHWLICGQLNCTRKSVGLENTLGLKELSTQAWFAFPNVCDGRHFQKSLVSFGWKKM